jgi:hypothetical protein
MRFQLTAIHAGGVARNCHDNRLVMGAHLNHGVYEMSRGLPSFSHNEVSNTEQRKQLEQRATCTRKKFQEWPLIGKVIVVIRQFVTDPSVRNPSWELVHFYFALSEALSLDNSVFNTVDDMDALYS